MVNVSPAGTVNGSTGIRVTPSSQIATTVSTTQPSPEIVTPAASSDAMRKP
jgi:hypothetical protein